MENDLRTQILTSKLQATSYNKELERAYRAGYANAKEEIERTLEFRCQNEYNRGWHDALISALKEAINVSCDGEVFKMVQVETLKGLGLSRDYASSKSCEIFDNTDCILCKNVILIPRYENGKFSGYESYCKLKKQLIFEDGCGQQCEARCLSERSDKND